LEGTGSVFGISSELPHLIYTAKLGGSVGGREVGTMREGWYPSCLRRHSLVVDMSIRVGNRRRVYLSR
jgi:hypothetical protein